MAATDIRIVLDVDRAVAALAAVHAETAWRMCHGEGAARLRERLAAVHDFAGRALAEIEAAPPGRGRRP